MDSSQPEVFAGIAFQDRLLHADGDLVATVGIAPRGASMGRSGNARPGPPWRPDGHTPPERAVYVSGFAGAGFDANWCWDWVCAGFLRSERIWGFRR